MSDAPNVTTKTCSQCRIEKPVYEFHKHAREKDGYRRNCKQCRAGNGECSYIKPAPPGFKWCRKCDTLYPATTEHFYWNSSNTCLYASCKSCHYLRTRNWQKENLEFWYGLNRQWGIAHPELKAQMWQNWKRNHPDSFAVYSERKKITVKAWIEQHPDQIKALKKKGKAKRRAILANAPGTHTAADIRALHIEQQDLCVYCGIRLHGEYHLDHVQPLSRNGTNDPGNLCLTCAECNLSKSNKTLTEWAAVRGW